MMRWKVVVTLTEEMLGTASANKDIYSEFIGAKCPENSKGEELTLPEVDEEVQKSSTVFHRTPEGGPMMYDYQIKGFFKDACSALRRGTDTRSKDLKAHLKVIDGLLFVLPRTIPIQLPAGGAMGICERPLRAQTAKGERIALARSETVPVGSTLTFDLLVLNDGMEKLVEEWLQYGALRGLGQWRNSGKGRFSFTRISIE